MVTLVEDVKLRGFPPDFPMSHLHSSCCGKSPLLVTNAIAAAQFLLPVKVQSSPASS